MQFCRYKVLTSCILHLNITVHWTLLQYSALITTLQYTSQNSALGHQSVQITTLHWSPLCTDHHSALNTALHCISGSTDHHFTTLQYFTEKHHGYLSLISFWFCSLDTSWSACRCIQYMTYWLFGAHLACIRLHSVFCLRCTGEVSVLMVPPLPLPPPPLPLPLGLVWGPTRCNVASTHQEFSASSTEKRF
jgi:hypothetical protein